MAQTRFIHNGDTIDYTPQADLPAGAVVVQGDLLGVTKLNISAGKQGGLAVKGVFDFPKATTISSAIAVGAKVYWDATNSQATTDDDSGVNKYLGKSIRAAVDTDDTVRVRLEQ
jgi:predicted RecA/RadA family phage recombinase